MAGFAQLVCRVTVLGMLGVAFFVRVVIAVSDSVPAGAAPADQCSGFDGFRSLSAVPCLIMTESVHRTVVVQT